MLALLRKVLQENHSSFLVVYYFFFKEEFFLISHWKKLALSLKIREFGLLFEIRIITKFNINFRVMDIVVEHER